MSEYIGMGISIGGELPANKIVDLLTAIGDDLSEITGPTTVKELKAQNGKTPKWYATSNYGECDDLKAFCGKNKLSYLHHCESTGEYDASIAFWTPGMKAELIMSANHNGSGMIQNKAIKPYVNLLLALAKDGTKALPLFLNIKGEEEDELKNIVEAGLKGSSTKRMFKLLEKRLNALLPLVPTMPPLTIKE